MSFNSEIKFAKVRFGSKLHVKSKRKESERERLYVNSEEFPKSCSYGSRQGIGKVIQRRVKAVYQSDLQKKTLRKERSKSQVSGVLLSGSFNIDAQLINPEGDLAGRLAEVQECRLKALGYADCRFPVGWINVSIDNEL
jgi:hypothetical protein